MKLGLKPAMGERIGKGAGKAGKGIGAGASAVA